MYLSVGSQLPESTLFVKSNIPSPFKHTHTYLTRSDGMRKTPSSFCAFEFCSGRDGTEKAWRAYRENRHLCIESQNSKWVCLVMFVRFVRASIKALYLFIMFIYIRLILI